MNGNGDLLERKRIAEESRARVSKLSFGDPVTNICAGEGNPHRHSVFVNKTSCGRYVRCTDKKGHFWQTGIEVIHPGWLDSDTCAQLYAPVWESNFK